MLVEYLFLHHSHLACHTHANDSSFLPAEEYKKTEVGNTSRSLDIAERSIPMSSLRPGTAGPVEFGIGVFR